MKNNKVLGLQQLGPQWTMDSPFLFCAHHNDKYPKANEEMGPAVSLSGRNIGSDFSGKDGFNMYHGTKVPGFPAHPHRGFETVTVVLNGFVDHFDSSGANGRYGNGDVQWLTTGNGCQHSEMFPLLNTDRENPIELFQIWLNLPAADKKAKPHYKMFWNEDIPETDIKDNTEKNTHIRLIAGNIHGVQSLAPAPDSWANNPDNHVRILLIQMERNASFTLPAVSESVSRNLYFYQGKGSISIDGLTIKSSNRIKLNGNADIEIINGDAESYFLLLEGEPIRENVVQYGPFVMNTKEEIQQAIYEYQQTEYGGWPWDRADVVHSRNTKRFAKYSNGHEEHR
ncbi:MAG: pirin family protein [Paludibacter sp.]|nr:pirin family protein [Paludibacter sp.]